MLKNCKQRRIESCIEDAIISTLRKYRLKYRVVKYQEACGLDTRVHYRVNFRKRCSGELIYEASCAVACRLGCVEQFGGMWENSSVRVVLYGCEGKRGKGYSYLEVGNDFSKDLYAGYRDMENRFVMDYRKRTGFKPMGSIETDCCIVKDNKIYPEFGKHSKKIA